MQVMGPWRDTGDLVWNIVKTEGENDKVKAGTLLFLSECTKTTKQTNV